MTNVTTAVSVLSFLGITLPVFVSICLVLVQSLWIFFFFFIYHDLSVMGGRALSELLFPARPLSLIIHCRHVSLVLLRHEHSGAWAYSRRLRDKLFLHYLYPYFDRMFYLGQLFIIP